MKIAIDLDRTYEDAPHFFDGIALRFQLAGHKVGILTARSYDEGCITLFQPDFVIFLDIGNLSYEERGAAKAARMHEERIDILFDDRANYIPNDVVALHIL